MNKESDDRAGTVKTSNETRHRTKRVLNKIQNSRTKRIERRYGNRYRISEEQGK
jgi:hypothetical protein